MFKFLIRLLSKKKKNYQDDHSLEFVWALTGNIVKEHEYGEEKEIRKGSKHFSPGAKVYCIPEFGGKGHDRITAIGIPRKKRRHIKVILPTRLIENWRIKKVYHPRVVKILDKNWWWGDSEGSKKDIMNYVDSFIRYPRE